MATNGKATQVLSEQITLDVMKLPLNCNSHADILRHCAVTYGIREKQTEKYIAKATVRVAEQGEKDRTRVFHRLVARFELAGALALQRVSKPGMFSPGGQPEPDVRALIAAMKEIAVMHGLSKQVIELPGPDGAAIPTTVKADAGDRLDDILRESLKVVTDCLPSSSELLLLKAKPLLLSFLGRLSTHYVSMPFAEATHPA